MPYLHWDTDRNRSRMAEVMERRTDQHLREELKWQQHLKEKRMEVINKKTNFPGTCLPYIHHKDNVSSTTWRLGSQATRTFEDIAWAILNTNEWWAHHLAQFQSMIQPVQVAARAERARKQRIADHARTQLAGKQHSPRDAGNTQP